MAKRILTLSISAFISAAGLLLMTSLLPPGAPAGAAPALAPMSQDPTPQIARNTMLEDTVELPAGTYRMVIAELGFDPGAETPLHVHPGPSVGYILDGRIAVSVSGQGGTNTYSGGSAVNHPWNIPHVFRNSTDQRVDMLSFEIFPLDQSASENVPGG